MLQNQDFCSISVHGNEIQYRIGMWIYKIAALLTTSHKNVLRPKNVLQKAFSFS